MISSITDCIIGRRSAVGAAPALGLGISAEEMEDVACRRCHTLPHELATCRRGRGGHEGFERFTVLAVSGVYTALGTVAGVIYLVFIIYCAVVTLRKGQILLFILGFFCGICWIIGLLSVDKRHEGPGASGHYVPPTAGT